MKKQKSQGLGLKSDTEVIRDINRAASKKQRDTIKLNDDYRAYCKNTTNPIPFIEFKSEWYKKRSEKNRKKFQNNRSNVILEDKGIQKSIHREAQTEYGKLCKDDPEFKKTITFKEFLKLKQKQFLNKRELMDKNNKGKLSPTLWDKLDNDPRFKAGIESRSDDMGHYTGSLGKAWGSPKVRYPRR
jgi:hypothetical protein